MIELESTNQDAALAYMDRQTFGGSGKRCSDTEPNLTLAALQKYHVEFSG
jgi:hypothetical protein